MKLITFLLCIVYMPILIAMEKDPEKINTSSSAERSLEKSVAPSRSTNINPLNVIVPYAFAKLKQISYPTPVRIYDIFPLEDNQYYLRKLYGQDSQIIEIAFDGDNYVNFNYTTDVVVALNSNLQWIKNKNKKKLFNDVAQNLSYQGQFLLSIPTQLDKYHPLIQALKEVKSDYYPGFFPFKNKHLSSRCYYAVTSKIVQEYINDAQLTLIEITPYTQSILFKNVAAFKAWLHLWMPLSPVLKKIPKTSADSPKSDDLMTQVIDTVATIYLKNNPAAIDGTLVYSYQNVLVHAQNQTSALTGSKKSNKK